MFYPEKLPANFHYNFSLPFAELNYEPGNDVLINALLFKADHSKGVVFYSHGNAGNLQGWGSVAGEFTSLGFDALIYDYRTFGKSKGKLNEQGLYNDAEYIYNELKKEYSEDQIIVYGRSIGTGIAAHVASRNNPRMLILETPFFSGKDLASHYYPWLPTLLLKYNFRTDLFLPSVKCPVYLFHGTDDEIVYYESSIKLSKLFKKDDKLFTIEGGHHNDLSNFAEYKEKLKEILVK